MSERKIEGGSEEKLKRVAVAMSAAGVLLVLFLIVILVIQFVQMGVKGAELRETERQLEEIEQLEEQLGKDIDFYSSQQGLRYLAMKQGWYTPRDQA